MTESDKPEHELVSDLEERRRRLGEQERSETRPVGESHNANFRTVFESAPVGIAKLDGLGRVIDGNNEFLRLFGFSLEEYRGRAADRFHPPE